MVSFWGKKFNTQGNVIQNAFRNTHMFPFTVFLSHWGFLDVSVEKDAAIKINLTLNTENFRESTSPESV